MDTETVLVVTHERMLSDAVRDGRVADLASALAELDDDLSGFDPLYQIAAAAIAAAVGKPQSLDQLEQLWVGVRGTFRAAAGAGLIVRTLGDLAPPAQLADELTAELAAHGGCWLVTGTSVGIGPADSYLARLLRLRGRPDEAARHARMAAALAHRFAPTWIPFTKKESLYG